MQKALLTSAAIISPLKNLVKKIIVMAKVMDFITMAVAGSGQSIVRM